MTAEANIPCSPRAEESVIGAAFIRPTVMGWLDVDPGDFFDPRNRHIWEAMREVYENQSSTLDEVLVEAELVRRGVLDAVGGVARLGDLVLSVPTADNVEYYAAELVKKRVAREALHVSARIRLLVERGLDGDDLADEIQRAMSTLSGRSEPRAVSLSDAAKSELKAMSRDIEGGHVPGAPTGIQLIDDRIGGIPSGVLSVIAARPSIGKSAFALNVCEAAAMAGWMTILYTFEDSVSGFAQRALAKHAGIEATRIRGREISTGSEMAQLTAALDPIRDRQNVLLVRAHGMTVERLIRSVRVERQRHRAQRVLVVVDYMQLVPASHHGMRKHERVAHTAEKLSEFAGEDGLAVVGLSQLNRESEKDGRAPKLSDIRDSGEIEQVGKLVLALHDPGKGDELQVFCLKNHQGPRAEFRINFDRQFCRIW